MRLEAWPAPGGDRPGPRIIPRLGMVRRPPARRRWMPDVALAAGAVGFGASIGLPLRQASVAALRAPGGAATLAGDVTAMAGTYLLLVAVLLAARIPALERALGQDRLLRLHRRLAPAPLLLLGAHAVLTTLGTAQATRTGLWSAAGPLVTTMSWILAAVVSYAVLVAVAVVSVRAVKRHLGYDTWWVIHLYTYLALALSVPHQVLDGTSFVGHPLAQALWLAAWSVTAGVVVAYRLGLPVLRSVVHRLRVIHVQPAGPGVWSLVLEGRHLERLPVAGGQYCCWRFLTRGMWWHAHPFSFSALPRPPYVRVTVKAAGDATSAITKVQPGTRVALEGPYGTFTQAARGRPKVALIGAGVGVTPLRALLEDLPRDVDVVVLQRASAPEELIHGRELAALVGERRGRMVPLVGTRAEHPLHDPWRLHQLVPDLAGRDVFICGPDGFAAGVARAARTLGTDPAAIHIESFTR